MDNAGYVSLTRQTGLLRQLEKVANNVANASTTGFRREELIFSEYALPTGPGSPSLSMATANARFVDTTQGALVETGNPLDFAISGQGFFVLQTPDGNRLTRAGAFTSNAQGELVSPDGYRVLDSGGSPIFIPPAAHDIKLAPDGTLSADGQPLAQLMIAEPSSPTDLANQSGVLFKTNSPLVPVENTSVRQGFLEQSNVNPVTEITRLIEIQRNYELGQKFLDREDQRIRSVIRTLGR